MPESPSPLVVLVSGGPAGPLPRVHPADAPLLVADDLAAVRGDGVFDAMLVSGGRTLAVGRHLARLRRSMAALDLTGPDEDAWRRAIGLAEREWAAAAGAGATGDAVPEAVLRLVVSRGPEHGGEPTAYLTAAPVGAAALAARANGVAVCTLDRGYSVDLAPRAPWALVGAKTLSYATNMAAQRYARAHGFDDAIYLSSEGDVLEGPRTTVVIERDGRLVSPPDEIGILPGTTAQVLFAAAEAEGIGTARERLVVTDLLAAQAVWVVSSVTLAARVTRIDDVTLPAEPTVDVARLARAGALAD